MSPNGPQGRPDDDIRTRLRRALGAAIRSRDTSAASALRSALSAIGNAEAVDKGTAQPAGAGSAHFAGTVAGLGAGEADRRVLTDAEKLTIVRAEAAERQAAALEYERAGRAEAAVGLRRGAERLISVLDGDG